MARVLLFSTSILAVFFLLLGQGNSLVCYSCSSSIGHGAACENITDHLSDISHHECFYNDAVCAMYKISYGNDIMIYRSCKEAGICLALSKKLNRQYNNLLDCQTCNSGDLCNSAVPQFTSFFKIHHILILMFIIFRK